MDSCLGTKCTGGFIGEMGLGFSYEITDNFLIRSDIRYRYNNNFKVNIQPGSGTDYTDMLVNVGFVIPFGEKPKAVAKTEQPAPLLTAPAPSMPAPAVVDCSKHDSDADGVNDCQDKCPNTPKASKVDNDGCPIKLVLKGQHFKVDSAVLTAEARGILDEVAASVNAYPEKNDIEVQGHTSSEGGTAHNLKLSQNRANRLSIT